MTSEYVLSLRTSIEHRPQLPREWDYDINYSHYSVVVNFLFTEKHRDAS